MLAHKDHRDTPVSLHSVEIRWRRCLCLGPRGLWKVPREDQDRHHHLHESEIDQDHLFGEMY